VKHVIVIKWLAVGGLLAGLTGCASNGSGTATPADLMREHASEAQAEADAREELAQSWERGQELVDSGNQKIESGERRMRRAEQDLERARQQVEEGNREVVEGNQLAREAERQFSQRFPGVAVQPED
jgi:exonuclease VII small subunit